MVAYKTALSTPIPMASGVSQGSVLGPFLYALFTADVPHDSAVLSTFADDTAILSRHAHINEAIRNLQTHLLSTEEWSRQCRLKINESKSKHVTFTLRKGNIPQLHLNQQPLPQADKVKYLGIHFDRALNWKYHITQTRNQPQNQGSVLDSWEALTALRNKTLLYKVILRPVWTYGIELWGCASSSNIEILQRYQSKLLRLITQAPWYVANHILHNDLDVPKVREIFQARTATHHTTLAGHPNSLMRPLTEPPPPRRLKRTWTFDALK